MTGFHQIKLGNVLNFQRGFDITKNAQTEGEVPIVSSSGISSYHNQWKVKAPGVVIGRKGTLGTVHFVRTNFWPHDTTLWVKDFKGNNPRFLNYFLQTLKLENFDVGASNPTLNRNHVHKIKVIFPKKVDTQKWIAAILSAYDEQIENNKQRISLMQRLALEIYREWFVRLRFPGYQEAKRTKGVPNGWVVAELRAVSIEAGRSTKPGIHLAERLYLPLDLLNTRQMIPAGHLSYTEAQSSLATFEKGDILFGAMRPYLHKVAIAPFAGITRTTCFVIRPKLPQAWSWLYLTLFQQSSVDFATMICNGSDRPYAVWNKGMERMKILRPEDGLLAKFEEVVRPILDSITSLYFIQLKLANCRNLLLPRLISGKLSVENLDIQFPPGMADELETDPSTSAHA